MLDNNKLQQLEKEGLIDAFGLAEDEIFEARFNLLGFFDVLARIDQRLKVEKENNKHLVSAKIK